jgi:alpha-N-arabinofuranosidase
VKGTNFELKIVQNADKFDLYYNNQEHTTWKPILNNWEGKLLSVEQSGGFMGAFVGLYTTSNGKPSKNYALYDWFKYIEIK